MGSSFSWSLLVLMGLLVLLAGLAIIALRSIRAPRADRQIHRRFFCPTTGAETDSVLSRDAISGQYLSVLQCAERELHPPGFCQEECVRKLNAGGQLWLDRQACPAPKVSPLPAPR